MQKNPHESKPSASAMWVALVLLIALLPGCGRKRKNARPDVMLISIDTLRADRVGAYGYERGTTPVLDALIKERGAAVFEHCFSQAPNTAPSHMTLLTSLYPTAHAVPNITPKPDAVGRRHAKRTRPLAQVLKEAGYRTAGLTDGGYLHPLLGFDQGFDEYVCKYEGIASKVDKTIFWLEKNHDREKPFFFFLHTYEVHDPYLPPQPFRDRFAPEYSGWVKDYCFGEDAHVEHNVHGFAELFKERNRFGPDETAYLSGLYDGEIAYTDHELGRLWKHLGETGLWDDLVVIIVADHGEEFGEHGEYGHKQLYDETLHVPLIWFIPRDRETVVRRRIEAQVSLIDVMPSLLDLLGVDPPSYLQGRSLRPLWKGDEGEERPSYSELIGFDPEPISSSIRFEDHKMISTFKPRRVLLYDLVDDEGETTDRFHEKELEARRLFGMLGKWHEKNLEYRKVFGAKVKDATIDEKLYNELKALGY